MNNYIVDESKFLISDEDDSLIFPEDYKLSSGIVISSYEDGTDKWELYTSKDGEHYILAVNSELHDKWIDSELLKNEDFQEIHLGQIPVFLIFSKISQKISRLNSIRDVGSATFANAIFSAFVNTRSHDIESNLRDGIYIEKFSLILPTYSLVSKVSDKALFNNVLSSKLEPEDLSAPGDINDTLSYLFVFNQLKKKGLVCSYYEPLLESGQNVDDFMQNSKKDAIVLSPLISKEHYQLIDTSSDYYLLLLDKLYANALIESKLLRLIDAKSVSVNGDNYYLLTLSKDNALELLSDRYKGISLQMAYRLAVSIRRTRNLVPRAVLSDALYIEQLNLLFPDKFSGGDKGDDKALMLGIINHGPYALSPFLIDINDDLIYIATR